jgi:Flp pilus assembly pilin Flp
MRSIRALKVLLINESGQNLIEYALVILFVALVAIACLTNLRNASGGYWNKLNNGLSGTQ